ncbi:MAG TPA: hypothetical protein VF112_04940 [Candidatus Dormibacteraeota bacterium]
MGDGLMRGLARYLRSVRPVVLLVTALACVAAVPAPAQAVIPPSVPRAVCDPGSLPERGAQGRVTAADLAAGTGAHCNLELIGHEGSLGGFRTYRYVDASGHECAFYDTTAYLPTRPSSAFLDPNLSGTHVLDMSDPAHPRRSADLTTPAMRSPHESLSLHAGRGLLAADMGSPTTAGPFVDVYDVKRDCRHPVLLSSLPIGVCGHEGSFSPDGNTYWVSCGAGFFAGGNVNRMGADKGFLTAVDVSDPVHPRALLTVTTLASHGLNLSPDGATLYYAEVGAHKGLGVLDVNDIQQRRVNPRAQPLAQLSWDTVSIPQTAIPVSIGGHPYLVEVDEFASNIVKALVDGSGSDPAAMVGAARIIDVADPRAPRVVSDIRLAVHSPEARAGAEAGDPGASVNGYAAHYCAVPRQDDPGIVACSFIASGLRVFDIRDPFHPVEIAYFNPPITTHDPYADFSAPAFVPERDEIWYTDGNHGFYTLRVTNGVWRR